MEYRAAPEGRGLNTSRTTVDLLGNVWAGNRAESAEGKGSVVKVGLRVGGKRVNIDGTANPNGILIYQRVSGPVGSGR